MSEAQVEPWGQASCFSLPYSDLARNSSSNLSYPWPATPLAWSSHPSAGLCRGLRPTHPASLLQACHSLENIAFWLKAPLAPYFKISNMHSYIHISEPHAFLSSHAIDHCDTLYFTFLPCLSSISLPLSLQWKVHRDRGVLSNLCIAVAPGP